jgi:co-chaperonin GroES (HSP10)
MKDIKVIEEWILVKPEEEGEKITKGGIVIPEKANKPQVKRAQVIQISDDVPRLLREEKGPDAKMEYGVGDTVLFYGKTGIPIEEGKDKYMFLKWDGMLAISLVPVDEPHMLIPISDEIDDLRPPEEEDEED